MDNINLSIIAGVEYRGKLYVSTKEINGLFCLDLSTREITFLKEFSGENEARGIYRNAFLYKNEAWFIPGRGQRIAIVNLDTLDIEYYEFPFQRKDQKTILQKRGLRSSVFSSGGIIADKFLYLIPQNVDTVVIVDMERKKFYPYYGAIEVGGYPVKGTYANGNLYLLPEIGDNLIAINLVTKEKRNYFIKELSEIGKCAGIVYYDNSLWAASQNGRYILHFGLNIENIEIICLRETRCGNYQDVVAIGSELYFLPHLSDRILNFNMKSRQLSDNVLGKELTLNGKAKLQMLFLSKEITVFYFLKKNLLLYYNRYEKICWPLETSIERKTLYNILYERNNNFDLEKYKRNGCYEEDVLGIRELTGIILEKENDKGKVNGNTGRIIWDVMRI